MANRIYYKDETLTFFLKLLIQRFYLLGYLFLGLLEVCIGEVPLLDFDIFLLVLSHS